MKRSIAVALTMLFAAVPAVPASAQAPNGNGLVDFGTVTCDGIGEASLIGPRGLFANSGYLVVGEDVEHVMLTQLELTVTDENGNVVSNLSKSFGTKVPYSTFACTQEFEEPGGHGVLTVTLALVPPN
jgi:hypothetical protein